MSIEYVYANHSKKQYFDIGLFGESCRLRHAGFSCGSRVLSLLISERGSWNGDSIEMVDDVSETSVVVSSQYTNIRVEAELLILDVDGAEYFNEASDLGIITFTSLCLYAMILARPEVIELLDEKYGTGGWQKMYKEEHYRDHKTGLEYEIYESQGRNIVLYDK